MLVTGKDKQSREHILCQLLNWRGEMRRAIFSKMLNPSSYSLRYLMSILLMLLIFIHTSGCSGTATRNDNVKLVKLDDKNLKNRSVHLHWMWSFLCSFSVQGFLSDKLDERKVRVNSQYFSFFLFTLAFMVTISPGCVHLTSVGESKWWNGH